ncbi:uncharacterized protein B0J16DRAFT_318000 [Fusarium flagelliforme]|uniref:uncharacterized protein n=1 Tax=Fusarium flagelliforme TaxID=2675880 RepID=UPI001E8E2158|nr:uncharacterized protein B0J16DRAFT_318000 [Fusarium flagelliforme]KAH7188331.1 hypothetical protein B0J16DRAFT_318000 [Fusarium flagelliforme]
MSIDKADPAQHQNNNNHLNGLNGHPRDETDSLVGSSPEGDHHPAIPSAANATQEPQQPKRKGGRKPIYATSEERKQRNRQAQAAFRERRTEYIKQLEETIRVHESNLHNLQAAHRTAADECLMLRYKNSLLERILLEKGIDVQAELRAKTGSPNLGPTHMPQNIVQPPPIQRAIMNRHHQSRRSNSNIAPKAEPVPVLPPPLQPHSSATSPKNRPTPSSHSNSPSNTGSAFSPAASDNMSMRGSMTSMSRQQMPQQPQQPQQQQMPQNTQAPRPSMMQNGGRGQGGSGASYYPTPAFQNHIEQLEQEYDAQADMIDEPEMETPAGHGGYPSGYNGENQQPMMMSPASSGPGHQMTPSHEPVQQQQQQQQPQTTHSQYPSMTQLLDQNGLDWDPFGLSASMAFPNGQQFQFEQANMR